MPSKKIKLLAVALTLATAAYWYWSPFIIINSMRSSALKKDADSFNEHVDYPKLRESLKGQFKSKMASALANTRTSDNEFEQAGAALGSMLGLAMVDRFVDALVQPETVMRALGQAKFNTSKDIENGAPKGEPSKSTSFHYKRVTVDKLIAYSSPDGTPLAKSPSLVFERSGFANWKLTEVRVPLD